MEQQIVNPVKPVSQKRLFESLKKLNLNTPQSILNTLSCIPTWHSAYEVAVYLGRSPNYIQTQMKYLITASYAIQKKQVRTVLYKMQDDILKRVQAVIANDQEASEHTARRTDLQGLPENVSEDGRGERDQLHEDRTAQDLDRESSDGSSPSGEDDAEGESRKI